VFCHYDRNGDGIATRFVHNKTWKLYETGEVFNIANDPLEEVVLTEDDVPANIVATFQAVLSEMR
ncbi:MAG: arylsulfatase, partial [Bacteroidota bacterium]